MFDKVGKYVRSKLDEFKNTAQQAVVKAPQTINNFARSAVQQVSNVPLTDLTPFTRGISQSGIKTPTIGDAAQWVSKNYIYNPQSQRVAPASPLYGMADSSKAYGEYQSGKINKQQLTQRVLEGNLPIVMGISGGVNAKNPMVKPNYTPITLKNGQVAKATPQEQLKGLLKAPKLNESSIQQRGRMIQEELLPWETAQTKTPIKKVSKGNPVIEQDIVNEIESFITKQNKKTGVPSKVNIFDYLRTPDRVLEKIGLGQQSKQLRSSYDTYKKDLVNEIGKISEWQKQVPNPESSVRIFRYLDGNKVKLTPEESKVAKEIQGYLGEWADKLNLPKEKRIASYITHIFDFDQIQKDFDPEIANLIRDRVPGSVYDPFLQKRLGKYGYVEDTWRALDAYVKRATRKYNMDPALKSLQSAADGLDDAGYKYVKSYGDRINMRPTELDSLVDNIITQSPVGYKFGNRPVTVLSQKFRQTVYRAALGLNFSSALRNLSQGANTYAKLGEKYTITGYATLLKNMAMKNLDELYEVGILNDDIIQDRKFNAVKSFWEKADNVLFTFFETAEKINRGSAYFGAKAKAIAQGLPEEKAIEYAKKVVRDTQFTFGSIDTPLALSSDIAKTAFQFQSYPLKQMEFLGGMVKDKDILGLARYVGATLFFTHSIGKLFGYSWQEAIPFFDKVKTAVTGQEQFGRVPQSPFETVVQGLRSIPNAISSEEENEKNKALENIEKAGAMVVPAGVQLRKTLRGLEAVNQGYSDNATGKVQYPVDQTPGNYVTAGIFGKNRLPEAQEYFKNDTRPLSDKQTKEFLESVHGKETYKKIMDDRANKANDKEIKDKMKKENDSIERSGEKYYVRQKNGDIKTIDLGKEISKPKFTGNEVIDKQLLQKYNSQVTRRASEIADLVQEGQISQQEAEKMIQQLYPAKTSLSPKEGTSLYRVQVQKQIGNMTTEINNIVKLAESGGIGIEEAGNKITELKEQQKILRAKIAKPKKLRIATRSIAKVRIPKIKSPKLKRSRIKKLKIKPVKLKKFKIPRRVQ